MIAVTVRRVSMRVPPRRWNGLTGAAMMRQRCRGRTAQSSSVNERLAAARPGARPYLLIATVVPFEYRGKCRRPTSRVLPARSRNSRGSVLLRRDDRCRAERQAGECVRSIGCTDGRATLRLYGRGWNRRIGRAVPHRAAHAGNVIVRTQRRHCAGGERRHQDDHCAEAERRTAVESAKRFHTVFTVRSRTRPGTRARGIRSTVQDYKGSAAKGYRPSS